ncbi:hypothetical protein VB834_22570 [Limnoraphis robusta Tam1]|uniref:hypothetical protein n=1 Tax=Limnoraphis robusta TaxID=1118279 RepID=UPI002B220F3D|nr:hypothetical protein [Limnoraphis robusta]MEA5499436.1 hypothetical protein [Limnoraphis robusta BA-68 BA1]MEA5541819.1 hypothetical protein [Limnoraphis robusta Tam1]
MPEPLLIEVLNFIQSAKNDRLLVSESSTPRIPNLHQGEIGIGDDFNDPLGFCDN